jgi:hypothetical protein
MVSMPYKVTQKKHLGARKINERDIYIAQRLVSLLCAHKRIVALVFLRFCLPHFRA